MADVTIAFYGIRMEVGDDEVELLETRWSHPVISRARSARLQWYWGNFASPDERNLLFVGRCLGAFGIEGDWEVQLTAEQFMEMASEVGAKLLEAGFQERPMLYVQYQPDD